MLPGQPTCQEAQGCGHTPEAAAGLAEQAALASADSDYEVRLGVVEGMRGGV